jgi:hypothetical protein
MVDVVKQCRTCRASKPLDAFGKHASGKHGIKAVCKACHAEYARARRAPDKLSEDEQRARYTKYQTGPKTCTKCGIEKDRSQFSQTRVGKYGPILMSCCKECARVRALQWFHDNRERALVNQRHRSLSRTYGITIAEYDAMSAAQGHVCAICKQPEARIKDGKVQFLAVDHCHDTGRVRGLLCNNCNRAVGLLKDDVAILRRAVDYLEGR